MFDNIPNALAFVQKGAIRALAVSSSKRMAVLPDVPTLTESGYPGFKMVAWVGLVAPAGTPKEAVDVLSAALEKAVEDPEVVAWIRNNGGIAGRATPSQFGEFIRSELVAWRRAVAWAGLSAK